MPISKKRLAEIAAIADADIDTSDIPEAGEEFFKKAKLTVPGDSTRSSVSTEVVGSSTKRFAVPAVSVTYARNGSSTRANALGMRPMQERAYERRGEQYLLIKSPPASGKSRALMFIALATSCTIKVSNRRSSSFPKERSARVEEGSDRIDLAAIVRAGRIAQGSISGRRSNRRKSRIRSASRR
jgi:hypothetical protein